MRDNAFSKLKKAIRHNDKAGIARAIFTIKPQARHIARARRAVTRGQFIKNEINRALRHLKQMHLGAWPPTVTAVFNLCKEKLGDSVWNEAIYTDKTPNAPAVETPTVVVDATQPS